MRRLMSLLAGLMLFINVGSRSHVVNEVQYEPGKVFLTKQLTMLGHETIIEKEANKLATKMWGYAAYKREVIFELQKLAKKRNVKWEWLVLTIHSESRGKAWIQNKYSNATGIIQWLPSTARSLGTSVKKLQRMNVVEQIPYIDKYFESHRLFDYVRSYEDLYLGVFHPTALRAIGKGADDYIIGDKYAKENSFSRKAYDGNSVVDTHYGDNDGLLEVTDFKRFARRGLDSRI